MPRAPKTKRDRSREAAREAVAQAGAIPDAPPGPAVRARGSDPFSGELRRREVLPSVRLR